jgi:hypothetical protein
MRSSMQLSDAYYAAHSPLNDKSLSWTSRPLVSLEQEQQNKKNENEFPAGAMLVLTDYGWNQRNQTEAIKLYRGIRMRELIQGVVDHEWFHPTAWTDVNLGKRKVSNTTRYYVFLDRDTCAESNYPHYNHGRYRNRDSAFGRGEK